MPATVFNLVTLTANTEQVLVGPNLKRRRIEFYQTLNTTFVLLRVDPQGNVVGSGGLPFIASTGPVVFTLEQHGEIVQRGWWGFSTGAPGLCIVETLE